MSISTYESRKYQCTICLKRFKATNHLREHMTLHSDKPNYKCEKCQMEFKSPGSWRNHMRKVHGFECPQCGKNFSTLTLLKQHRMSKHRDFMRQKLEDEVGMIDKSEVNHNFNGFKSTSGQKNSTKFPPKKITTTPTSAPKSIVKKILKKSKQNSSSGNAKSGKFVCKKCGFRYALARSLRRHVETAHQEKLKYACTQCDYKTNRSDNFKLHNQRHSTGQALKCSVPSCNCLFFSVKNLRIHTKRQHGTKITNVKKEFKEAELDENEKEFLDELDRDSDDNENEKLEETVDSFQFHNNSFLNSTEKSTKLNNSPTQSKPKKTTQLKISTCFSLNSKKESQKKEQKEKEKPKSSGNSVSYECCECKIDFPGNNELWEHLLAIHFHKMKNNVKKS